MVDATILSDIEKLANATKENVSTVYSNLSSNAKDYLNNVSTSISGWVEDSDNKQKVINVAKSIGDYFKTRLNTAIYGNNLDGSYGKYNFTYKDAEGNDINKGSDAFTNLFRLTKGTSVINPFIGALNISSSIANYALEKKSSDEMKDDWISYGSSVKSSVISPWENATTINDIPSFFSEGVKPVLDSAGGIIASAINGVGLAASQAATFLIDNDIDAALASIESKVSNTFAKGLSASEQLASTIYNYQDQLGSDSVVLSVLGKGLQIFSDSLVTYQNGVSETSFGRMMESSWSRNGNASFMSRINKSFVFSPTTPLDSGDDNSNIYGKMMLGTPPLFTHITDPQNRTISTKYLSDTRFLTLYPGFPQYNGSNILLSKNNDQYHQTPDPQSMIDYLKKHGFDSTMYAKDRRYYTFKSDYDEYYRYLETMLNAMWIKMGLSETNKGTMNLYSFFNIDNNSGTQGELKNQYRQGIGFFVSQPQLTEAISTSSTSYGSKFQSDVNNASETYNQINYLSGMGTGGAVRNALAVSTKATGLIKNTLSSVANLAANTIQGWQSGSNLITKAIGAAAGAVKDAQRYATEEDLGAILQSYAVTNGMKIVYPELWADTMYSKAMSFDVEFTSPYGDPLSIFQYVMVPFAALACFAMPRQAADNGYVSPFFVRADIPGLLSCDFGLITDFNWTRGGSQQLWTKDGLPRSISCTFSIQDLYPYLAMTKRLSFLSANPNYTSWIDTLSGIQAVNLTNSNDALNEHWKKMLNHISGNGNNDSYNINSFSMQSKDANSKYALQQRTNKLKTNSINIPWLRRQ